MDFDTWETAKTAIENLYADTSAGKRFCHYTTSEAVLSIFQEYLRNANGSNVSVGQCKMRASHIRFLNDEQEYQEGLNWLKGEGVNVCDTDENIYSISFCGDPDLLSQWKWYGRNSGIAIVFNIENIKYGYFKIKKSMNNELPTEDIKTKPLSVCYTDEERKRFYQKIKDLYTRDRRIDVEKSKELLSGLVVPFCKNSSFSEEKESRLVFYTPEDIGACGIAGFDIQYYSVSRSIRPVLNVEFLQKDKDENIISELIVGPGQDQAITFNALVHMFDNGYCHMGTEHSHTCRNGVKIKKSKIPFRG